MPTLFWSDDKDAYLRERYLCEVDREIGQVLGRSAKLVKKRRHRLGLIKEGMCDTNWTPEQDTFLRAHHLVDMTIPEIAQALGRTRGSTTNRAIKLKLTKRPQAWKHEEDDFLRAHYLVDMATSEIAQALV